MVKETSYTPPQVAELLGVNCTKVGLWIRTGELRAINVALSAKGKPRYRIFRSDLEAFASRRAAVPEAPPAPARKRRPSVDVPRYV